MWRCSSHALVWAVLATLLVAWHQGFEHVMPPSLHAVADGDAEDGAAPPCCGTGTGQLCQAGCVPAKAGPANPDRIASRSENTLTGPTERLEGRAPTPDPMPPEPSRA